MPWHRGPTPAEQSLQSGIRSGLSNCDWPRHFNHGPLVFGTATLACSVGRSSKPSVALDRFSPANIRAGPVATQGGRLPGRLHPADHAPVLCIRYSPGVSRWIWRGLGPPSRKLCISGLVKKSIRLDSTGHHLCTSLNVYSPGTLRRAGIYDRSPPANLRGDRTWGSVSVIR